jgi:hypothetical protein
MRGEIESPSSLFFGLLEGGVEVRSICQWLSSLESLFSESTRVRERL